MIKGVNRQVIEVMDTGNEYYERALLILKPEYAEEERELLEKEAHKVLKSMGIPSAAKKRNKVMYWLLRLGGAAAVGAGFTALMMVI